MLNSSTDLPGLVKNAFVHLKGVSDEWLQSVQVDKVAGGQLPADQNFRVAAEFAATGGTMNVASCCSPGTK
jgi:hypothetical protein